MAYGDGGTTLDWRAWVTEQRVWVSATRIRIPDVILVREEQQPDVTTEPPLLVVEILSPDDSYSDTEEREEDYFRMGVSTVWIIDPKPRTGRMCDSRAWVSSMRLEVVDSAICVDSGEILLPRIRARSNSPESQTLRFLESPA